MSLIYESPALLHAELLAHHAVLGHDFIERHSLREESGLARGYDDDVE